VRTVTGFVLRHRRLVGLVWLIALLAGGYASATITKHLSQSFAIPGTPSAAADGAIVGTYRSGGSETPLVPVIELPPGQPVTRPAVVAGLRAGFAAAARVGAGQAGASRVVSYASTGDPRFASADGRTTFGLIFTPTFGDPQRDPVVPTAAVRQGRRSASPGSSR